MQRMCRFGRSEDLIGYDFILTTDSSLNLQIASQQIRVGAAYSIEHPKAGQMKWHSISKSEANSAESVSISTTIPSVLKDNEEEDDDIIEVKYIPAPHK